MSTALARFQIHEGVSPAPPPPQYVPGSNLGRSAKGHKRMTKSQLYSARSCVIDMDGLVMELTERVFVVAGVEKTLRGGTLVCNVPDNVEVTDWRSGAIVVSGQGAVLTLAGMRLRGVGVGAEDGGVARLSEGCESDDAPMAALGARAVGHVQMETGVLRGARVSGAECSTAGTMSLRGVKVVDARECGVLCSAPGSRLSMHGCSVVGSGYAGVLVGEGATATLTEVDVRGGELGICTLGGRVDVQGGVVSGCAKAGVHAQGGGQVSATAVSVHHCFCGLVTKDSASKITATRVNVHAIDGDEYYTGNVVVVPDASPTAAAPPSPDRCTHCGAWAADLAREDRKLRKCSRCQRVRYCGRECQRAHWRAGHKAECQARGER